MGPRDWKARTLMMVVRVSLLKDHLPLLILEDGPPARATNSNPLTRSYGPSRKKATKELRAYDGDMAHYDNWRRRIRDHFVSVNRNYSRIFNLIETSKSPIKWNSLATTYVPELPYLDWQWVATHLWAFTAG